MTKELRVYLANEFEILPHNYLDIHIWAQSVTIWLFRPYTANTRSSKRRTWNYG